MAAKFLLIAIQDVQAAVRNRGANVDPETAQRAADYVADDVLKIAPELHHNPGISLVRRTLRQAAMDAAAA